MNLALEIALSEYGVKEIVGDKHNPEVLKYFTGIGYQWIKDDETSWCSAFVNWCCKGAGLEYSGKLDARSWLRVGENIQYPAIGDIVILWRESPQSWKGHVGFYINQIGHHINILGGNQQNMVCIMPYQINKLLACKRLKLRKLDILNNNE